MAACETCDGKGKVPCEDCDGSGETHGNHVENCDVEGCETCEKNTECETCRLKGEIDCPDCGGSGEESP